MDLGFIDFLKENGWMEVQEDWEYRKNNWFMFRDTGTWWMLGTLNTPRLFDIPEPREYQQWTINLIELLCRNDDELNKYRKQISK